MASDEMKKQRQDFTKEAILEHQVRKNKAKFGIIFDKQI